jgi:ribose/xylose/arabinose/galactoside ABC-type transport system permease subunit/ABC-type sugar transport system substrate-binding protein
MGKPQRRFRMREFTVLISVILAVVVFGLLNRQFLDVETVVTILENAAPDGLIVIGMSIVIICGAFDMSVGSAMAVCGLVAALVMNKAHLPVPLAMLAALAAGTVIGWSNGSLVTRLGINPFITTLGMMSILRGVVQVVTRSAPLTGFPESFLRLAWGTVFTLHLPPNRLITVRFPVVLLVVSIVVGDLLLRRLQYLRQVYFVGSNEEAARLTGIPTAQVKTFAFMLTGVLAAMAGLIATSRANALDANAGMGAELRVIAAVIVGGASLSGGRGTILGSFLGLLLMQIITTGLVFIGVAAEAQLIAVGLVLILAAVIDRTGSSALGRKLLSSLFTTRNKPMERVINVILAIALVAIVVFFACQRRPAPASSEPAKSASPHPGRRAATQHYVMISAVTGAPYWIDLKDGLRDKAEELGVEANFAGPPTVDVNAQIDEVNRAIARKVDGIIMVAMADSVTPAIDQAIAAGIPVVCADADAPSSKRYSFIGTGNYNAGFQGGEELARLLDGKGEVALLAIPGWDNLAKRVKGYQDALAKYPNIKIVQVGNDHGSQIEAEKECRALIQVYPNLAGFGCVAAAGGQGAAVAVKQAGKVGKIKIVAMDRDEATLQFIQEGVIDASIAQRTYTMSYLALQMLYDLRNEQIKFAEDWHKAAVNPLPPNVDTGSFIITKKNVDYFRHNQ